eukprot:CAMPEP_0181341862 /NCGR_PEP_ID=MMETSP1101-20121128/30674_1 /TAXON_ID=46948 /ORGANISM="Rhodomonas abbreviata, Strain Caron Lab Isolate" /LENGTH=35 /DNA_ID= /DNA_START= /DNA_END= /DNA_ORIENTATION=
MAFMEGRSSGLGCSMRRIMSRCCGCGTSASATSIS